jgi:hypothetical protein
MAEKITPERRRKRGSGLVILLLLLAVLLGLGLLVSNVKNQFGSVNNSQTHIFAVSGIPKLVIHDGSGTVHIHRGGGNSVIVQATKQAVGIGANLDDMNVNYSQNGNEVDVSADQSFDFFLGSKSVNFDVTLPANANMQVETGSGSVEVADINGQEDLQTGSGSINATDIGGQISLRTGSGSIGIDSLNGHAMVSTDSGTITMNKDVLSGDSLVKTGSGTIDYNGSIDPQGSYRFETGSGAVDITLPANSAFHLHTSTGSGSVNNDFGSTNAGTGQQPDLSITTGSGDINLHKGQ